jgi:hypothetical protein
VREGKFHIYAIHTVDDGISILTGVEAGERDPDTGEFPPGTVHGLVAAKLARMYDDLRRLGKRKDEDEEDDDAPAVKDEGLPSPPDPPSHPPRRGR